MFVGALHEGNAGDHQFNFFGSNISMKDSESRVDHFIPLNAFLQTMKTDWH